MKKLLICYNSKESKKLAVAISQIRPNSLLFEEKDINMKQTSELANKKGFSLFIGISSTTKRKDLFVCFGRNYGEEILDFYEFKVITNFIGEIPLNFSYLKVFSGITERENNLYNDIFNTNVNQVVVDNIEHALCIFKEQNDEMHIKLHENIKTECDKVVFNITMSKINEQLADDDEYMNSFGVMQKKKKNIKENEMMDRVGRIHLEKQDLKDIKLKKSRGFKNK